MNSTNFIVFYRFLFAAMYEASRSGIGRNLYNNYVRKKRGLNQEDSEESPLASQAVLSGKRLAHVFRSFADTAETFDRYVDIIYVIVTLVKSSH